MNSLSVQHAAKSTCGGLLRKPSSADRLNSSSYMSADSPPLPPPPPPPPPPLMPALTRRLNCETKPSLIV